MTSAPVRRTADRETLARLLRRFPVVALLGPRHAGKSTLARRAFTDGGSRGRYFDLEDSRDVAALADPAFTLDPLRGLVVLDGIHRTPGILPALKVLADRRGRPARFLVVGSETEGHLRRSTGPLAGRIAFHELAGLSLADVGAAAADRLWLRGGLPGCFLAADDAAAARWRVSRIRDFLEGDLPGLGITTPPDLLRRFWTMAAQRHGQVWRGSDVARGLGIGESSVRRHLALLQSTFALTVLRPWHETIRKRQVKSPRVYVSDTGLLHSLLGLKSQVEVDRHAKSGSSWEGFALSAVVRHLRARPEECWFWRTHAGAELDLLIVRGRRRYGFEFQRTSAPGITKSMHIARADLKLDDLVVVHAGKESFPLTEGMRAVALRRILKDLKPLR